MLFPWPVPAAGNHALPQYLPCPTSSPSSSPQVLSDVVESLLGAVYVDTGGDLSAVWAVAQVRWLVGARYRAELRKLRLNLTPLATQPGPLHSACWTHW